MIYDGWVYVAECGTGEVKIGMSKEPLGRIKHFDTIMPIEVRIIATIPCDDARAAEKLLHHSLSPYRVKGEWFNVPEKSLSRLVNYICFLDGGFIERHGRAMNSGDYSGYVNSCCTDFFYARRNWERENDHNNY